MLFFDIPIIKTYQHLLTRLSANVQKYILFKSAANFAGEYRQDKEVKHS